MGFKFNSVNFDEDYYREMDIFQGMTRLGIENEILSKNHQQEKEQRKESLNISELMREEERGRTKSCPQRIAPLKYVIQKGRLVRDLRLLKKNMSQRKIKTFGEELKNKSSLDCVRAFGGMSIGSRDDKLF